MVEYFLAKILKCSNLLLFCYIIAFLMWLDFGMFVRQNKSLEDVVLASTKLRWEFLLSVSNIQ